MMKKLEASHEKHIQAYGQGNEERYYFLCHPKILQKGVLRLTGEHETASMDKFSFGVADRGSSIRIPTATKKKGCGYFEDRRPAANCCPYIITALLVETCLAE